MATKKKPTKAQALKARAAAERDAANQIFGGSSKKSTKRKGK